MNPSANAVLLVRHTSDHFTEERMAEAPARREATVFRLGTNRFPADIQLSASFEGINMPHTIRVENDTIRTGDIRFRKPSPMRSSVGKGPHDDGTHCYQNRR